MSLSSKIMIILIMFFASLSVYFLVNFYFFDEEVRGKPQFCDKLGAGFIPGNVYVLCRCDGQKIRHNYLKTDAPNITDCDGKVLESKTLTPEEYEKFRKTNEYKRRWK